MEIIVYSSYYHSAHKFLTKMREEKQRLDHKKEAMEREFEEAHKQNLTIQMGMDEFTQLAEILQILDHSLVTQICACMAVEAFINLYGVSRLDEDFYKRNIERIHPISRKIEVIVALVRQEPLSKEEEILELTRRMFKRRNELVHPKPKKFASFADINFEWEDSLIEAENSVKDMEHFFDLFKIVDPNSEDVVARMKQHP